MNFYHQLLDSYSRIKKRKFSISIQEASTGKAKIQPENEAVEKADKEARTALQNVANTGTKEERGEARIEKIDGVVTAFWGGLTGHFFTNPSKSPPQQGSIDTTITDGATPVLNVGPLGSEGMELLKSGKYRATSHWMKFVRAWGGLTSVEAGVDGQTTENLPGPTPPPKKNPFDETFEGVEGLEGLKLELAKTDTLIGKVAEVARGGVAEEDATEHWQKNSSQYATGSWNGSMEWKLSNIKGINHQDQDKSGIDDSFSIGGANLSLPVVQNALETINTILKFGTAEGGEVGDCTKLSNSIRTETGGDSLIIFGLTDDSQDIYIKTPGDPLLYALEQAKKKCTGFAKEEKESGAVFSVLGPTLAEDSWEVESLDKYISKIGHGMISDLIGKHREKIGEITAALAALDPVIAGDDPVKAAEAKELREQYQEEVGEWARNNVRTLRAAAIALADDPFFSGGSNLPSLIDFHNYIEQSEEALQHVVSWIVEKDAEMIKELGLEDLTFAMQVGFDVGSGKKADLIRGSTDEATVKAKAHELGVDMQEITVKDLQDRAPKGKKKKKAFLKKVNLLLKMHGIDPEDKGATIYYINISEKFYRDKSRNGFKGGEIKGDVRLSEQHAGVGDEFAWHHPMRERIFGDDAAASAIAKVKGGDEAAREKAEKEARRKAAEDAYAEIKEYDGELQTMRDSIDSLVPIGTGTTKLAGGTTITSQDVVDALASNGDSPFDRTKNSGVKNKKGEVFKVTTVDERRLLNEKLKCETLIKKVSQDIAADGTPPPAGPARKWLAQTIQLVAGSEHQELIHVLNSGRGTHAVMNTRDVYDTVCKAILNGEEGWTISTGSASSDTVSDTGRYIIIKGPNDVELRLSGSSVHKGESTTWAVSMNDNMVHENNKFRKQGEGVEASKERILKHGHSQQEAVDMRSFLNAQLSMIQELLSD
jgi:hypothetical protein